MKREAAGAHHLTPRLFEPTKRPTREPTTAWTAASSPSGSTRYSFSHLSGVGRALWMGEQWRGLGTMSISSELDHLADADFLALGKYQRAQASLEPGIIRSRVLRSAAAPHWAGTYHWNKA